MLLPFREMMVTHAQLRKDPGLSDDTLPSNEILSTIHANVFGISTGTSPVRGSRFIGNAGVPIVGTIGPDRQTRETRTERPTR
jgi:hypothetical protein